MAFLPRFHALGDYPRFVYLRPEYVVRYPDLGFDRCEVGKRCVGRRPMQ